MKAAWDYDAVGDLETVTRSGKSGGSWVVAGVTAYTHDDLGRTTNFRLADVGDKTISEYGYTFDDADRITGMSVNGMSRTFGYDDTNQITNDNGTARTYDANGNRTGGSYATDDANRMTTDGTWTYTYDDAGQATGKSKSGVAWTYEYDHRGQLVEASDGTTTVSYSYDAFGNRIGRVEDDGTTETEERYVVDGWDTAKPGAVGTENFDVVMDLDDEDDIVARRLFGPGFDELVGGQDGGCTVRWYGTDHLGSVRKVFDNSGTVTNTVDYDAFGGFLGGVPVDRYAYTGREWDATTGLTHYRAREKDGHRFLTEDPERYGAGDPNLGRYVGNGAINGRDPSGLWELTAVLQKIRNENSDVADYLLSNGARFNSYRSFWGSWGSVEFELSNGRPIITLPDTLSSEDAAMEILTQFGRRGFYSAALRDFRQARLVNMLGKGKKSTCVESESNPYSRIIENDTSIAEQRKLLNKLQLYAKDYKERAAAMAKLVDNPVGVIATGIVLAPHNIAALPNHAMQAAVDLAAGRSSTYETKAGVKDGLADTYGLLVAGATRLPNRIPEPVASRPINMNSQSGKAPSLTATRAIPSGLTKAQFNEAAALIRSKAGNVSNDIVVQGSRASGTAGNVSDIDIAVRVTPETFGQLIRSQFGTPNPCSAWERTMQRAIETGKIQRGEMKWSKLALQRGIR